MRVHTSSRRTEPATTAADLGLSPSRTTGALCAQVDPRVWFPEDGERNDPAIRICRRCTVRVACLEDALSRPEQLGVAGGLSARKRQKLRRERMS